MEQEKQDTLGNPEQNGNPLGSHELTLSEEAAFLIRLVFEEFEELLSDYPHHAAYCFASITPSGGYSRRPLTLRTAARDVALD